MEKYARLGERVLSEGILTAGDVREAPAATDDELLLVHNRDWVERVRDGGLEPAEIRRLGFPWSPEMVERSRRSVGATIAAARVARTEGVAANLAGGTHHAFADHGEGYCVFNDAAVALRVLQREGLVTRALVVDLDVHQGNGTAAIFADDPHVVTLSVHGARNFPFRKVPSDVDLALPDATGDEEYLSLVAGALDRAFDAADPELTIYVSGADPHENDRLGRLALTRDGLTRRDELVFRACERARSPVAVTMAGGYGRDIDTTVDVHLGTLRAAAELHRRWGAGRISRGP
ncbi:MAG: histone deacetylase [Gemmatimonadetes bacterium]|nr:histone deacetylase [Gemmatimonadota bacterium]